LKNFGVYALYALQQKLIADYEKADAGWWKARRKTLAKCRFQEADADQQKAYEKAYADQQKAYEKAEKAYADWRKVETDLAIKAHKKVCHSGCPWDGITIFSKK
jgi:hypothetical protein